jgi:hypothetical protein|tara:strand:- start:495 stop:746 length:252 start_codon:yes stop_codon:yes gene_type:complete
MKRRGAPRVEDAAMQRVISDIYDIINELIDHIDSKPVSKLNLGKRGKLNIVKRGKDYTIEVKTSEGWFELSSLLKRKTVQKGN